MLIRLFSPYHLKNTAGGWSLPLYSTRFLSTGRQDVNRLINEYLEEPMSLTPNPERYEHLWSSFWKANNSNPREVKSRPGKAYSLLFPPPNITGQLHLGHALTLALQDSFIRHQRMFSDAEAVFIPGFDHAGIATYIVLDKTVRKSLGKGLEDLTETEFQTVFSQWKNDRIKQIKEQLDRLGSSLDHQREYFTLDENLTNSVNHAFIHLHEKGLIYRSNLPVNWSYFMQSALSDLEVTFQHIEGGTQLAIPGYPEKVDFGLFHTSMYPVVDGEPGESISVSTMNIYTVPGDVAILVNPEDPRYTKYHGKRVLNPLTNKEIPVIPDPHARIDFGTGAVKITPSSSYTDYEIAIKHNLPIANFMNADGTLMKGSVSSSLTNLYKCSHRYELAKEIIQVLKDKNLYCGCVKQATKVPFCKRSNDVIEHRIVPQWFLNVKPGYDLLRSHIENNAFQIFPPRKVALLTEWFAKKRDWCLSRQIPFGHQVPAWKAHDKDGRETWFAALDESSAIEKAAQYFGSKDFILSRDKDVLDTWFSSALLPLSTLGWPRTDSPDFEKFFPLTLMETGFDIITFWVMKMALLSLYLTGKLPFSKVYLHGMVCDGRGRKMSKSKGNVINPLDVINGTSLEALQSESKSLFDRGIINQEELTSALETQRFLFPKGIARCGADGLRFSLYEYNSTSEKIAFSVNYLENNRHLVNKVWQAFRFYMLHAERDAKFPIHNEESLVQYKDQMSPIDRWIIGQLHHALEDYHTNIENFSHSKIYRSFFIFWVKSFCDIYIEVVKPRDNYPLNPLSYAICGQLIKSTLIAMHPMIPFVTEELFQRMSKHQSNSYGTSQDLPLTSILNEKFPNLEIFKQFEDSSLNHRMNIFREVGRILGSYRSTCGLNHTQMGNLPITLYSTELNDEDLIGPLKRIRNVHGLRMSDSIDHKVIESTITMKASANTIISIPYDPVQANQILKFLQQSINRLPKLIEKEKSSDEKRLIATDYLERITADHEKLAKLISVKN